MYDIDLAKIFNWDPLIMEFFNTHNGDPVLDHHSFRVFSHIASWAKQKTYQNTTENIGKICGMCEDTVQKKVKLLEQRKLLKVNRGRNAIYNSCNQYTIPFFQQKNNKKTLFFLHWYLDLYGLKPTEFRLLCHILSYPNCEIQQSYDCISKYCGFKRKTIKETADKLEEYKIITTKVEGNNKKFYKVQDVKNWISPEHLSYDNQEVKKFIQEERNKAYKRITKQKVETIKKELWKLNHDLGIIKMTDQDQLAKFQEFYQFLNSIKIH